MVLALRNILMGATAPPTTLLIKLSISSFVMLGLGIFTFRKLKPNFYDYL